MNETAINLLLLAAMVFPAVLLEDVNGADPLIADWRREFKQHVKWLLHQCPEVIHRNRGN
jgi:hypothetical protein